MRAYYATYGDVLARPVTVSPAPWWLNGRRRGFALASTAPPALFALRGGPSSVSTLTSRYRVTPLGPARPLSAVSLRSARPAVVAAVGEVTREGRYQSWTVSRQTRALRDLACARDEYPDAAAVDLTDFLPFLPLG